MWFAGHYGVALTGGGYAKFVVTKPDSVKCAIYFQMSLPLLADTSQADCYPEFRASKEKYLHIILIGIERYKIPDAVILGG